MAKIGFTTLGCKANWVDTESLIQMCSAAGMQITSFDDAADIYVVNTCTVTAIADQQSRQMLRRARRKNPRAIVVAAGCMGETGVDQLASIEGIDAVFGTSDREELLRFIFDAARVETPFSKIDIPAQRQSRARAFLKIQDGCDRRCAYCIVPKARGRNRSVSADLILDAARSLAENHKEIVLTGIDIGQYGRDNSNFKLVSLLNRLIESDLDVRYRLSSLDPTMIDDDLISLMRDSGRICRHIHLSMQSCSDSVLAGMNRGYGVSDIRRAVIALIEGIDDVAVTGDVIAGFPGEGDEDHDQTMDVLSALPIAGLHVFPFSPRCGTKAHSMPGQVNIAMMRNRAALLRDLATELRRKFLKGLIGKRFDSIVTSKSPSGEGAVSAFSDNAVSISLPAGAVPYGGIGKALIERVDNLKVSGSWC